MQVSPALLAYLYRVHWCRWSGFRWLVLPFVACSLVLSVFLLCPLCVACKYALISRFKGVFSAVWGVCVGLCGLRALRGLWGFCVRERLGGLKACGVFAFLFSPFVSVFALLLCSLPALLWLSSCLVFALFVSLWLFVRWWRCFFPFGCTDKKKGRKCLRPLLSCCGLFYLVAALYSSYSSGVSPFIS